MNQSIWPQNEETVELLDQVRNGEDGAVDKLLDKHRDSLRRMIQLRLDQKIMRRVGVSDVIQDVLVEANRRLKDYLANPVLSFHLWIRQIAKDRIIDAHRRHRMSAKRNIDREQPLVAPGGQDHSTMELAGRLCDPGLTPAAAATQREIATQVESAVHQLKGPDREIILMRHYEQLSNLEAAQSLGLSEPAASMRYLRALRRLREILDEGFLKSSSEGLSPQEPVAKVVVIKDTPTS
jgi:RNA polymerase sigma-70 factor, ECF subfamily